MWKEIIPFAKTNDIADDITNINSIGEEVELMGIEPEITEVQPDFFHIVMKRKTTTVIALSKISLVFKSLNPFHLLFFSKS